MRITNFTDFISENNIKQVGSKFGISDDIVTLSYTPDHPNGLEGGEDEDVKVSYDLESVDTKDGERTLVGKREHIKDFLEDYAFTSLVDIDDTDENYFIIGD